MHNKNLFLQFEYFANQNAFKWFAKYGTTNFLFNNDIQVLCLAKSGIYLWNINC